MYKKFFAICIVLSLSILACSFGTVSFNPGQTVRGSGKVASETRTVSGFTSVAMESSADVNVAFGETESVVIEADDNILPLIVTKVQNGRLLISTKSNTSFNTSHPVQVNITMKSLDGITLSGSGNINVRDLNGETLKISLPGSGNITVQGAVNMVDISLGGSGTVSCNGLQAKTASVNLNGSGNVSVYASDSLNASINGSGNIKYSGNPAKVNKTINGSGNITP